MKKENPNRLFKLNNPFARELISGKYNNKITPTKLERIRKYERKHKKKKMEIDK